MAVMTGVIEEGRTFSRASARVDVLYFVSRLATLLETREDLPLPVFTIIWAGVDESEAKGCMAAVDQIAAAIGVDASWQAGRYVAQRKFGDDGAIVAIFVPAGIVATDPDGTGTRPPDGQR